MPDDFVLLLNGKFLVTLPRGVFRHGRIQQFEGLNGVQLLQGSAHIEFERPIQGSDDDVIILNSTALEFTCRVVPDSGRRRLRVCGQRQRDDLREHIDRLLNPAVPVQEQLAPLAPRGLPIPQGVYVVRS